MTMLFAYFIRSKHKVARITLVLLTMKYNLTNLASPVSSEY